MIPLPPTPNSGFNTEEIARCKKAQNVRHVLDRLGEIPEQRPQVFNGSVEQQRIADLNQRDLGTDYSDGPRLIRHHAIQAATNLSNIGRRWNECCSLKDVQTKTMARRARKWMENTRDRAIPALHGIDKERIDPLSILRTHYEDIEGKHLARIDAIHARLMEIWEATPASAPSLRKKLRAQAISDCHDVLESWEAAVHEWSNHVCSVLDVPGHNPPRF